MFSYDICVYMFGLSNVVALYFSLSDTYHITSYMLLYNVEKVPNMSKMSLVPTCDYIH